MTQGSSLLLMSAILIATLSAQLAEAGNTTCASKQLDWYSSVVGESPCKLQVTIPPPIILLMAVLIRYDVPTSSSNMQ